MRARDDAKEVLRKAEADLADGVSNLNEAKADLETERALAKGVHGSSLQAALDVFKAEIQDTLDPQRAAELDKMEQAFIALTRPSAVAIAPATPTRAPPVGTLVRAEGPAYACSPESLFSDPGADSTQSRSRLSRPSHSRSSGPYGSSAAERKEAAAAAAEARAMAAGFGSLDAVPSGGVPGVVAGAGAVGSGL